MSILWPSVENTEGEYSGIEHMVEDGSCTKYQIDHQNSFRTYCQLAFESCRANKRTHQSVCTKQILCDYQMVYFMCCREVSENNPDIHKIQWSLLDTTCLNMVKDPSVYDVLVMPNCMVILRKILVQDWWRFLVTPFGNIGMDGVAVFEAVHGQLQTLLDKTSQPDSLCCWAE